MTQQIDWDAQPLGKISDYAIADRLGCQRSTVRRERNARGIAPFVDTARRNIDWTIQPLGEMTDAALAKQLGVNSASVFKARVKLGIKPFNHFKGKKIANKCWKCKKLGKTYKFQGHFVCASCLNPPLEQYSVQVWNRTESIFLEW